MNDPRDVLDRLAPLFPAPDAPFETIVQRRRRRVRNRRLGGALVGVALTVAAVVGGYSVIRSAPPPANQGRPTLGPSGISPMPIPPAMHNGRITVGSFGGLDELGPGGTRTQLMACHGHCAWIRGVAWTTDGARAVFVPECGGSCASAGDPYHGIRVLDVRTGTDRLVAPGEEYTAVTWSPDGSRIAYAVQPSDAYLQGHPQFQPQVPGGGLFLMNADGSSPTRVPGVVGWIDTLSWSPDGTSILYSNIGSRHIYLVRLGGFAPIDLGPGRGAAWSPDGTRFAYSDGRCGVWIGRAGGARIRIANLISPGGACRHSLGGGPGPAGLVWSPDGRELALVLGNGVRGSQVQTSDLWVLNADGSPQRHVPLIDIDVSIAWRPVA